MPLTAIQGPYIPRADGALREWLDNFAQAIARDPAAAGLTLAEAGKLAELAQRYAAAYVRARSPGARSRVTVREKNVVRREVWDTVRPMAMRIKHNRGVSDGQKIALGIYPPLDGQSPIPRPRTAPRLELVEMGRGYHRLRFGDPSRPTRLGKPYGAVSLQLLIVVGRKPARSPREAHRMESKTRHVFDVTFTPADSGKTATYFARWATRRGKAGPWSRPLSMTVA